MYRICMYVYVCTYICILYVYICKFVYVCMYLCMSV